MTLKSRLCFSIVFLSLALTALSCKNETPEKVNQTQVDSLNDDTEEKAKKYLDSINQKINSMDDEEIVNDSNGVR